MEHLKGESDNMTKLVGSMDGKLECVPFVYVLGNDWQYLYSDTWKGEDFNVYENIYSGSIVAVLDKDI